ncbi:MAG: type II toxin-antitoxin system death-on-curing family toxin [Dechloromonas sp.]|jgi:death-on-curing protein|nr:type II toxin-antitoxin system death-on-curing family toxin [Dechloromonas sp.]
MTERVWIEESVVWAVHEAQLAEHGGSAGVRDAGLLASALARPLNLAAYGEPDVAALAAAYGYGIARNHPFIDGNKRAAFVCTELFLLLNGASLTADDAHCVATMLALAAGELGEAEFTGWLRTHTTPLANP